MVLVGLDGCRGGWIAAFLDTGTLKVNLRFVQHLSALPSLIQFDLLGVDMPMGLEESQFRAADVLAKKALGRNASRVFHAPVRSVLNAQDYPKANSNSRQFSCAGLSKQTWNIVPKIRELDTWLRADCRRIERTVEVHPELVFLRLNLGEPVVSKKLPEGLSQREKLLGIRLESLDTSGLVGKPDDWLDALAVLKGVQDWVDGKAKFFPPEKVKDSCGILMRIIG